MKHSAFFFRPTVFTLFCAASVFQSSAAFSSSTYSVVVDDYNAPLTWEYSRLGTNRGVMGFQDNGINQYSVSISNGAATVSVTDGWGGVWTSLLHLAADNDQLEPTKIFGPYIQSAWQGSITGVEIDVQAAAMDTPFTIELVDANRTVPPPYAQSFTLTGEKQTVKFAVSPTVPLKLLNWSVVDSGMTATVDEVRLLVNTPDLTTEQAVFLFSYGHLSQCYNPDTGLVRDQSQWPANESAAIQSTGMFALVTAAGQQLGYITQSDAVAIVQKTTAALKALPSCHGLLPHFVTNGAIVPGTEWSSIDTVIALTANLLAAQSLGLSAEAADMQSMLQAIDWSDLTDVYTANVSMGYDTGCSSKLTAKWDSFGSEQFLIAAAFSAANLDKVIVNDGYPHPPTWDGSGFNDELAALFFPMRGTDYWNNDWNAYRCSAFKKQVAYFNDKPAYSSRGLFGLSAGEVPEPWNNSPTYGAWGAGGWGGEANDGSSVTGYPIVAPHYAAMICKEHPLACRKFFNYLISQHLFSPMNNTESLGMKDTETVPRWSSLKGSWNLSMQALGAARALSGTDFAPYKALRQNSFLLTSYNKLMPKQGGAPCAVPIPFIYNLLLKNR